MPEKARPSAARRSPLPLPDRDAMLEPMASAPKELAPEPNFRLVTVVAGRRQPMAGSLAAALAGTAGLAAGVYAGGGWRAAALSSVAVATPLAWARLRRKVAPHAPARPARMDIVPWGVVVDLGAETRILRWGAVSGVEVETVFTRDQASDTTRHSVVLVATPEGRLVGHVTGDAPLECLLAHRDAYASEAEHVAAVDLEGREAAGEAWEPQAERLLMASRQLIRGGGLGIAQDDAGYRGGRLANPTGEVVARLRAVLRDRVARVRDPRPLTLMLVAELGLRSLSEELVRLVSSPHPLTAATARASGFALGLAKSRLGAIEEVAPFLPEGDAASLAAWSAEVQ